MNDLPPFQLLPESGYFVGHIVGVPHCKLMAGTMETK